MSILKLRINGRSYDIICVKDQHEALNLAATSLNERIDQTLLLMPKASYDMALTIVALKMQDELFEKERSHVASSDVSNLDDFDCRVDQNIAEVIETIGFYTKQLEDLALKED